MSFFCNITVIHVELLYISMTTKLKVLISRNFWGYFLVSFLFCCFTVYWRNDDMQPSHICKYLLRFGMLARQINVSHYFRQTILSVLPFIWNVLDKYPHRWHSLCAFVCLIKAIAQSTFYTLSIWQSITGSFAINKPLMHYRTRAHVCTCRHHWSLECVHAQHADINIYTW